MFLSREAIAERYNVSLQNLMEIAEAYYFQGRLDDALRFWQTSEQLLAGHEVQPVEQMQFLLRYGAFLIHNYFLTNREEELMLSVVQRARQTAESLQDEAGIATALDLTGQTLYYRNLLAGGKDFTETRSYFQQASELREKIGDMYNIANSLFYTGMTYILHSQEEQAREYYQRTLTLAAQHGNAWAESEANRHLADVSMHKDKDYEQALRYALRSLALREEMGFRRALPAAQLLVSDVYIELGDLEQALAYCQQAEQLSEEMNLRMYLMGASLVRGEIAYRRKQLVEAREHFEHAGVLAHKLNNAFGIADVNEKLAMLAGE